MKKIIFDSIWSSSPDLSVKGRYVYTLMNASSNKALYATNKDYPKDKSSLLIPLTGYLVENQYIELNVNGCYLVSLAAEEEGMGAGYYACFIKDGMVLPLSDSKMSESDILHISEVQGLPTKYITVDVLGDYPENDKIQNEWQYLYAKKDMIGIALSLSISLLSLLSLALVKIFL